MIFNIRPNNLSIVATDMFRLVWDINEGYAMDPHPGQSGNAWERLAEKKRADLAKKHGYASYDVMLRAVADATSDRFVWLTLTF